MMEERNESRGFVPPDEEEAAAFPSASPSAVIVDHGLVQDAGGWPGVFGRRAPLELEIGFGRDPFLADAAQARPDADFVGIEYDGKRVRHFARRIERLGLTNVRAVFGDAFHLIPRLFAPGEISRAYIHFPDPWHKKRQQKNRLLGPFFLELLFYHLAPGAELVVGTDSAEYADFIRESLGQLKGIENRLAPRPFVDRLAGHPQTRFETLFRSQGKPIHYFLYRRLENFEAEQGGGIAALRAAIPRRMPEMPHVVFSGALDLPRWGRAFSPFEWTEGDTRYRVSELWTPASGKGLLLEAVIVREGHDSLFYVEIGPKPSGTVLRIAPLKEVERDELLFRFLAGLARRLLDSCPETAVLRHNLGGLLPAGEARS